MRVMSPPTAEQLEFKHVAAKELKDKLILYNWIGLGWCAGQIRRPSGDKSKLVKVDGERRPANFIISYDDGEGPHCLTIGKYGQGPLSEKVRAVGHDRACGRSLSGEADVGLYFPFLLLAVCCLRLEAPGLGEVRGLSSDGVFC